MMVMPDPARRMLSSSRVDSGIIQVQRNYEFDEFWNSDDCPKFFEVTIEGESMCDAKTAA